MTHGTRGCYQAGCKQLRCRAAEAAYRAALRQQHAKGQPPLGTVVSAKAVWKQIESLRIEGFSYAEIARRLGLPSPRLRLHPDRVTLESFLKVRAFYRRIMLEADSNDSNDVTTKGPKENRRQAERL